MKFFHLSDLHIGLRLMNYDMVEDQRYILKQITDAALREQPDAVVIAGDIYDKAAPSAEAVSLFDTFLTDLSNALPFGSIMIISGNHDSAPRVNLFRSVLSRQNIYMVGIPPVSEDEHIQTVTLTDEYGDIHFYLLPFVRPSMIRRTDADDSESGRSYNDILHHLIERETINQNDRNVLVSHQFYIPQGTDPDFIERMDSEVCTVGNIDAVSSDVLEPFDYAALGHIHKPMRVGNDHFRYSGTPLAVSVSEAGQQKHILSVELHEKGSVRISEIPLTPLRKICTVRGTLNEILASASDDYVSATLTDPVGSDAIDVQDRIQNAFPHLLEIRREQSGALTDHDVRMEEADLDPFELCCAFCPTMTESEMRLLQNVINTIQEDAT